jgi:hypothetical protein
MSALDSSASLHRAHRSPLRGFRAIVQKDARAAAAPLAIAGVFAVTALVPWAWQALPTDLWDLGIDIPMTTNLLLTMAEAARRASIACCAVLPAWAGVEVAFLESGFGRRSVLAGAPTSPSLVIGSKLAVVLLCAALVAVSCAAAEATWRPGLVRLTGPLDRVPWLALLAACSALAGLGAAALGRSRLAGLACSLGLPALIAGAAWTFGARAWQVGALALAACAVLAWVALPAIAGETGCDPARAWRRRPAGIGRDGGRESGFRAGNRPAITVLLQKDARVVRPLVLAGLALVAGFVLFSLAIPLFGDRVMQDLGIREVESVARRLKASMPMALLAQLVMPAASAFLLAFCDGRAAGRPLCALPTSVRAVVASKAIVCLGVLALFSAISLALFHVSAGGSDAVVSRLLSASERGQLWAFLLVCASGIPWCLALPALIGDRRRAAIAAVVGVPILFGCFGLAMQWSVRAWHGLVSVQMFGVRSWPLHTEGSEVSFGHFPPVVVAWTLTGVVAAWLARPAIAGIASTVRVRVHASRAILGTAVASVALGSLDYALPGFAWSEYRANADWARQVRSAMSDRTIDQLARDVALRLATLPADPQRDAAGSPKFGSAVDAAAASAAIHSQPLEISRAWGSAAWAKVPLQGSFEKELVSGRARRGMAFTGPLECALAGRALRDPAAVEAEIRRIVDDPRAGGSARIVAAAWLGPVNAAMVAAEVLVNSPSAMERAFATVVLAGCSDSQRWRVSGGRSPEASPTVDTQPPLDSRNDPGFGYCMLRLGAINALHDLERRVRQPSAEDAVTGWLGLASSCRIDVETVTRARALLESGPSDLCEILQALGNLPADEYPASPDVVTGACECLRRPVR